MARRDEKSALDIVEEAVYLLRGAPAQAFVAYYTGTLPFLLAFLFFWADMGRSATAYDHAAPAALGMAALFLWVSACQAAFAQALRSTLTGTRAAPFGRLAFVQAVLQPTKFVTLPIAALITIPFAAVFAFYQNLMIVGFENGGGIRQVYESARRQAGLWQKQNWAILAFVSMLVVVVFLNI